MSEASKTKVGEYRYIRCDLGSNGFSGQWVYRMLDRHGREVVGTAPIRYCFTTDGRAIEPGVPAGRDYRIDGLVEVRVVRWSDPVATVEFPDGLQAEFTAGAMRRDPAVPPAPPAVPPGASPPRYCPDGDAIEWFTEGCHYYGGWVGSHLTYYWSRADAGVPCRIVGGRIEGVQELIAMASQGPVVVEPLVVSDMAAIVKGLEWMAGFTRADLGVARTLHYDMNGKAQALLPLARRVQAAMQQGREGTKP